MAPSTALTGTVRGIAVAAARAALGGVQALAGRDSGRSALTLVAPDAGEPEVAEIRRRAAFFFSEDLAARLVVCREPSKRLLLRRAPILLFGAAAFGADPLARLHGGVFDVDWRNNAHDGWNWIGAATWSSRHQPDLAAARRRLAGLRQRLAKSGLTRCYVFGTGPSLARAGERDWSDGIRLVCNTIVRDPVLWRHIRPNVLVAGDGIYHFGFTEFARAFRHDLRERLRESPEVMFVYPAPFDLIVRREMAGLDEQLIPLPIGTLTSLHDSVAERGELPALGNVLNLLLLPVGCALARRIALWGFDGRAPNDLLFWANAPAQSYTELLPTLQAAHPAFFDHHVPREDPEKYLRSVHGDVLEHALSEAERAGWAFEMLHPTWTSTLAKRRAEGVAATP